MNTPVDQDRIDSDAAADAALEEYLRGNSEVTQRYCGLDSASVPPALDQAVLAQARAAIVATKGARLRALRRWGAPLAFAASVVVVVSIVRQPAVQQEAVRSSAPAAAPSPKAFPQESLHQGAAAGESDARNLDATRAEAPRGDQSVGEAPGLYERHELAVAQVKQSAADDANRERKAVDTLQRVAADADKGARQVAAAQPVPSVPPAVELEPRADTAPTTAIRQTSTQRPMPQGPMPQEVVVSANSLPADRAAEQVAINAARRQTPAAAQGAGPRYTIPVPSASSEATSDAEKALREEQPLQWLEFIRQLRHDGKSRRADKEWQRFHDRYPEYPVDDADPARPAR